MSKITLDHVKRILERDATDYGTTIPINTVITFNEADNEYKVFKIGLVTVDPGFKIVSQRLNDKWEDN